MNASDPECASAREAMSANLDGDASPIPPSSLTEHLVDCTGCCSWYRGALEVRRRTRLTLVEDIPDLAARIVLSRRT
jgi:predicted anti-sigma-YlaC factor YlaD